MLGELANRNGWLTGGADGLNFSIGNGPGPLPDRLHRASATRRSTVTLVLFVLFVVARRLAQSPFGLSLAAIRENRLRAGALGIATSAAHRRDLHGLGRLRRRGRRAARRDDADRLARPVRLPPFGRRDADADHRRRRLPLRRPHRRRRCSSFCATSFPPRRRNIGSSGSALLLVALVLIGRERIHDFAVRTASLRSFKPMRGDAA